MATDHNHHHAHHADVAYEKTDLGHRGIWAFFAFLAVTAGIIFIAMGAMYKGFDLAQAKLAPEAHPMSERSATPQPDRLMNSSMVNLNKFTENGKQPLLQVDEPQDFNTFRMEEETLLSAEPWKDDKGNVHLPIARAMELVSQRSMPARANGANPSMADPGTVPTEAGFGGVNAVQSTADAWNTGQPEGNEQLETKKPETHSITPSAKRNSEMPEKKQ